jgi:hypothetical protein
MSLCHGVEEDCGAHEAYRSQEQSEQKMKLVTCVWLMLSISVYKV